MTKNDVIDIVTRARVDPTIYRIGGEHHEALCLSQQLDGWHVFMSERGKRSEEQIFDLEDEACVYFLKRLFTIATWGRLE